MYHFVTQAFWSLTGNFITVVWVSRTIHDLWILLWRCSEIQSRLMSVSDLTWTVNLSVSRAPCFLRWLSTWKGSGHPKWGQQLNKLTVYKNSNTRYLEIWPVRFYNTKLMALSPGCERIMAAAIKCLDIVRTHIDVWQSGFLNVKNNLS